MNYQSQFGFPSWPSPVETRYESLEIEASYHNGLSDGLGPVNHDAHKTYSWLFLQNTARITLSPSRPAVQTTYNYSVKIMNASRKSQYIVRKLKDTEKFTYVDTLKEQLTALLGEEIQDIGYIEPGHSTG